MFCVQNEKDLAHGHLTDCNSKLAEVDSAIEKLLKKKKNLSSLNTFLKVKIVSMNESLDECKQTLIECDNMIKYKKNTIDTTFTQQWMKFESNWINWDHEQVFVWFQKNIKDSYNNNNNQNGNINNNNNNTTVMTKANWDLIETKLKQRELGGNFLLICTDLELKRIGFDNEINRKYLIKQIENLTKKYPNSQYTKGITNSDDAAASHGRTRTDSTAKASVCCMCLDAKVNTVFTPCGHACMCKDCSDKYTEKTCPICRKEIENKFNLFMT